MHRTSLKLSRFSIFFRREPRLFLCLENETTFVMLSCLLMKTRLSRKPKLTRLFIYDKNLDLLLVKSSYSPEN